jgi:hypothetical protein
MNQRGSRADLPSPRLFPRRHPRAWHRLRRRFGWFRGPMKKVVRDDRKDYGEERFNMLAKVEGRVFHVTFTERGQITWIISARKANKREQRRYEKN